MKSKHHCRHVAGRREVREDFFFSSGSVKLLNHLHLSEQHPKAAGAICFCASSASHIFTILLGRFSASCAKLIFRVQPRLFFIENDRYGASKAAVLRMCILPIVCPQACKVYFKTS